jgi:hypothetical protein
MRKQARRLWLGDWHGDEEAQRVAPGLDQTDTVLITPEDEEGAQPPEPRRDIQRRVAAGVAIGLIFALGFIVFSGGGADKPPASEQAQVPPAQIPPAQIPQAQPQIPQGAPPQGFGGPDLTGAEATKAAQAAVAKYPGNVERVTRGPGGGGYVVHVIQPDGNEVHVLVDDQFNVRGSDAGGGPPALGSGSSQ